MSDRNNVKLSVIIPTLNRKEDLKNTVDGILNQLFNEFEIIIVDQSEKENFVDLSNLDDRIIHIRIKTKSASVARNVGLLQAQGDIVLFIDDDILPINRKFLLNHVESYTDEDVHGVVGGVLNPGLSFRSERHKLSNSDRNGWLFFPLNYNKKTKVRSGASCNLSVRRKSAISVGGMNERYSMGAHREESDFTYRLSNKYGLLVFNPDASLIHLQTPKGGIRNWSSTDLIKSQHHFDGAIYFIFQSVKISDWPIHWFALIHYFFIRKEVPKDLKSLGLSSVRFVRAIPNAYKMLKSGPSYLKELSAYDIQ